MGLAASCEQAVISQLTDILQHETLYRQKGHGILKSEAFFNAEQNSRLVKAAEQYYRSMFESNISSWNLRDKHMVAALGEIRRNSAIMGCLLPTYLSDLISMLRRQIKFHTAILQLRRIAKIFLDPRSPTKHVFFSIFNHGELHLTAMGLRRSMASRVNAI